MKLSQVRQELGGGVDAGDEQVVAGGGKLVTIESHARRFRLAY